MRTIKIFVTLLIINISCFAQQDSIFRLSINEAVEFSIENNLLVENSELAIKKAKWKVWETTAIGLPQVSGSTQYQNFPNIPTQLMPDFITGAVVGTNMEYFNLMPTAPLPDDGGTMPVQFGSKHNADWGISISQILFSGEYIVGLQAAKTFKLISEQNFEKAKIEQKSTVKQAYYLTLIATQSLSILKENYENIKIISENTQKIVDAGVSEQTQADQIKILELNLKNQISSLERQELFTQMMIKFQLGLAPTDSLVLTSSLDEAIKSLTLQPVAQSFEINNNIDYQMMNTQLTLKTLSLRQAQSKNLPTIVGFYSYSEKAMENEFNFFEKDTEWYPTSLWGVKIEVPIFSSGGRAAVIQQNKIDVFVAKNQQELLSQQLNIQFEQSKMDYLNAFENLLNQEQNMKLSQSIYNDTQAKYKQGAASSMDLTQSQNQYLQAESAYYQALLRLLNAKIALEKLTN